MHVSDNYTLLTIFFLIYIGVYIFQSLKAAKNEPIKSSENVGPIDKAINDGKKLCFVFGIVCTTISTQLNLDHCQIQGAEGPHQSPTIF